MTHLATTRKSLSSSVRRITRSRYVSWMPVDPTPPLHRYGFMNSLHYAPPRNWVNDPNGLIHHNGRYHLYFQYNPLGVDHTNLSWGHASSVDLVTWEDHPVAIAFDDGEQVYSGSVVVDEAGTTGFGNPEVPAFVALYTSMSTITGRQVQSVAYSTDEGLTWTKYGGNPVLDRGSDNFRDPKIIRWQGQDESYWVMVAVEAIDRQVVLYRSDDLLTWEFLSSFGPAGAVGGEWECPDLFPLRVDGTDETHWVLLVSLNPGAIAGGSGTQYFVGDFDGRTFTPHDGTPRVKADDVPGLHALNWLDFGHDCYAGVTFAGLDDDSRTLIAWMSNWDYARHMPFDADTPQRGRMTLPRRLSLVKVDGQLRVRQTPIGPPAGEGPTVVTEPVVVQPIRGACRIDLDVRPDGAAGFDVEFADDNDSRVTLTYNCADQELTLDRQAAAHGFPPEFAGTVRLPVTPAPAAVPDDSAVVSLTIWLDGHAVEVYAENGTRVLTELIGSLDASSVRVSGQGASVRVSMRLSDLTGEGIAIPAAR